LNTTAVLFDLDGTLLPFDQDVFIKAYFGSLAKKLEPYGFDSAKLFEAIWGGTREMVKNNGTATNEEVFWKCFAKVYGDDVLSYQPIFQEYYFNEFQNVKKICGFQPKSAELIALLKERGIRVILATNPLFPSIATESRIRWAGLSTDDFELYTTYENSSFCKPNPDYYREIISKTGIDPLTSIMVGNDVAEDLIAKTLGMRVFLLTDCLINQAEEDISVYPHGDFDALVRFIDEETK